jgi:hypothetical protein
MILIALCPLAKIFQKKFQVHGAEIENLSISDLMENPERIFKEEEFTIRVVRSCGDVVFRYDQPKQIIDPDLRNWLCGGEDGEQSPETDNTGIVKLPFDQETDDQIRFYMAKGKLPPKAIAEAISEARAQAQALSSKRVMKAVERVHNALKRQYQLNEEQKLGAYQPSATEFLCAYLMKTSEQTEATRRKSVTESFRNLMSETFLS